MMSDDGRGCLCAHVYYLEKCEIVNLGYCMYQSRSYALASLFTTRASSLGDLHRCGAPINIRSLAIEAAASHRGFFAHAHRLEVCGGLIGLGWLDLSFLSQ